MSWFSGLFASAQPSVAPASVPVAEPVATQPAVVEVTPVVAPVLPPAPALVSAAMLKALLAPDAELWAPVLDKACRHYEINTKNRLAAFLATIVHESGHFRYMKENLYYSTPARIRATWPSRFKTDSDAAPYAKNPTKLANKVYASRMGNGDEVSGDGARYIGRGLIQVTGRHNYDAASTALGVALADLPAYLETREGAAYSAAHWFSANGCLALADAGDIKSVRKRTNGGYIGLAEVTACYSKLLPLCGCEIV